MQRKKKSPSYRARDEKIEKKEVNKLWQAVQMTSEQLLCSVLRLILAKTKVRSRVNFLQTIRAAVILVAATRQVHRQEEDLLKAVAEMKDNRNLYLGGVLWKQY